MSVALGALGALAAALFSGGATPIDAGAGSEAALRAETCAPCHAAEHAEWRTSRHALAWNNELFQRDYRRQPRAWCRNCHAPLTAQQRSGPGAAALRAEGVSCAVCHLRDGRVHARSRRVGSPHDTVIVEDFGSPAFCAGCHQFAFPRFDAGGAFAGYTEHPMQDTVAELERNPSRPASCLACHGGGAGHRFPGAHDPAMLRAALRLEVCRDGDVVLAAVTNIGAGHNVPTGDVHRHVLLKAWYSTAPLGLREAFFGRRFALAEGGGKTTSWDSTIAPGQTRRWRVRPAELGEPAREGEPINIALRYVYGADEYAAADGRPGFVDIARRRLRAEELAPCP